MCDINLMPTVDVNFMSTVHVTKTFLFDLWLMVSWPLTSFSCQFNIVCSLHKQLWINNTWSLIKGLWLSITKQRPALWLVAGRGAMLIQWQRLLLWYHSCNLAILSNRHFILSDNCLSDRHNRQNRQNVHHVHTTYDVTMISKWSKSVNYFLRYRLCQKIVTDGWMDEW